MALLEKFGWTQHIHYGVAGFLAGSLPTAALGVLFSQPTSPAFSTTDLPGLGVFGMLGVISALAAWFVGGGHLRRQGAEAQQGIQPDGPASGGSAG